jgi:hypothetical protein
MIRKNRNESYQDKFMNATSGGLYCLQSGRDVQAVQQFFRENSEQWVERFDYSAADLELSKPLSALTPTT